LLSVINMNAMLPVKMYYDNCPESADGKGLDIVLDGTLFESRLEQRNFLQKSSPAMGPTHPSIQWVP